MTDQHWWVKTRDDDGERCWYCGKCEQLNYGQFPNRDGCIEPRIMPSRDTREHAGSETRQRG